jgi:thioredoxin-like negative regulator of GroEL
MDDGQTALTDGDFKAARDAFSDVIALEPRNSAALASLGYAYLKLDDFPAPATHSMRPSPRRRGAAVAVAGAQRRRPPWRAPATRCGRPSS